jgi:hypothetical protein
MFEFDQSGNGVLPGMVDSALSGWEELILLTLDEIALA